MVVMLPAMRRAGSAFCCARAAHVHAAATKSSAPRILRNDGIGSGRDVFRVYCNSISKSFICQLTTLDPLPPVAGVIVGRMASSTPEGQRSSALFPLAIFLGAFLLFQIQPILGRYVLPTFGGAPAVWTACMLFFQLLLVVGYAYAHLVGSIQRRRAQLWIHGGALLLSLLFFPIARNAGHWKTVGGGDPSLRIL